MTKLVPFLWPGSLWLTIGQDRYPFGGRPTTGVIPDIGGKEGGGVVGWQRHWQ